MVLNRTGFDFLTLNNYTIIAQSCAQHILILHCGAKAQDCEICNICFGFFAEKYGIPRLKIRQQGNRSTNTKLLNLRYTKS